MLYREPTASLYFFSIMSPNVVSLKNVCVVNMTLGSFEWNVLSVIPMSVMTVVSICDKNKHKMISAFPQHHEMSVISLTLQSKITQEEQSARP